MMGCCITGVSGLFLEHCTTVQQSRARERKSVRETPPTKTGWVSRESGPDFSRREQEMRREWKKQGGREGSPPFWTLELKEFRNVIQDPKKISTNLNLLISPNSYITTTWPSKQAKAIASATTAAAATTTTITRKRTTTNCSSSSKNNNLHTCSAGCPAGRIRSSSC